MLDGLNTRRLIRLDELTVSKHKNGHFLSTSIQQQKTQSLTCDRTN